MPFAPRRFPPHIHFNTHTPTHAHLEAHTPVLSGQALPLPSHPRNTHTSNGMCVSFLFYTLKRTYEQSYVRFMFFFIFFSYILAPETHVRAIVHAFHGFFLFSSFLYVPECAYEKSYVRYMLFFLFFIYIGTRDARTIGRMCVTNHICVFSFFSLRT